MAEDLRVVKTLENIGDNFLKLLKEMPFQKITINMLLERCRINRSTFYRYYEDKYDLTNKLFYHFLDDLDHSLDSSFLRIGHSNAVTYHERLKPLCHFFYENGDKLLIFISSDLPMNTYQTIVDHINQVLLSDIKALYNIETDMSDQTALYSQIFANTILSTMIWWVRNQPTLTEEEILTILSETIEKGVFYSLEHTCL